MTQTVSAADVNVKRAEKRTSPAIHYAKNILSQNKKFIILCFAMHLLGAPFFLLFSIFDIMQDGSLDEGMIGLICVLSLIIAFFAGVPIAMNCFRHLYDKQSVDMEVSLPLTMRDRFFAGYLSGLAAYVLPMIAAEVFAVIEYPIVRSLYISRLVNGDMSEEEMESVNRMFPALGMLILGGALLMTFFYSAYVLTMCFCGQKNECGGYGLAANFCIPAMFLCFSAIVSKYGFGFEVGFNEDSLFGILFWMTSPIGTGVSLGMSIYNFMDNNEPGMFLSAASFGGYVVKTLFMILITVGAAYFTYTKRRSEQTGKTFVFKGFYYFMTTVLCISILVMFDSFSVDGGLFTAGVISAIIYIILDSMANRGIKKLGSSVIKFLITFAGSFAIIMIIRYTGFFGMMYKTPKAYELSSVTVDLKSPLTGGYEKYTLTSEEAIKLTTEFQKESVAAFRKTGMKQIEGDFDHGNRTVSVYYTYKSGIKEERSYPLFADTAHYINEIMLLDEVKGLMLNNMNNMLTGGASVSISDDFTGKEISIRTDKNPEIAASLMNCYERDVNNLTMEKFRQGVRAEDDRCFIVSSGEYGSRYSIQISGIFTETVKYLSSFSNFSYNATGYDSDRITIAKAHGNGELSVKDLSESRTLCERKAIIRNDNISDHSSDNTSVRTVYLDSLSDEVNELLFDMIANSYSTYIPDGECYIIITGSLTAYVPEEYYADIEKYFM